MKKFVISILAFSFMGCATMPTPLNEAKRVPVERVYWKGEGTAKIVVVRDTGFLGSGLTHHFYINGTNAASLEPGERVDLAVSPGEYILGVTPIDEPSWVAQMNTFELTAKENKEYFYRDYMNSPGPTNIKRFIPGPPSKQ